MSPIVSVVIPAFNGQAFIGEAVASVLAQQIAPLEILIVDDHSTDDTVATVRQMEQSVCCLQRHKRGGPAAARNTGIAAARGKLVAFLDQDDLWPADHLTTLLELLDQNPTAKAAMGLTQAIVRAGLSERETAFIEHGRPWLAPHVGSALFHRSAFEEIGPFDERLEFCSDDLDWFMRARERGRAPMLASHVTYLFRIHETNTSRDPTLRRNALLEAAHASIRRRRANRD